MEKYILPYYLIEGIPHDVLYKKAVDCYGMFSEGLRGAAVQKYLNISAAFDDEEDSILHGIDVDELCFVAEAIVLYYMVREEHPRKFTLSNDSPDNQSAKNTFDNIIQTAFIRLFEDEVESMAFDKESSILHPKLNYMLDTDFPFEILYNSLSARSKEFLKFVSEH